jgi:glutathione S-transferase/alpha,alpha-trehalase
VIPPLTINHRTAFYIMYLRESRRPGKMMLRAIFLSLCLMVSLASAFVSVARPSLMARDTALAMGLTLYGSQGSRSPLVNWALYELGMQFSMGDLEENPHPFGQIPCLTDDNNVVVFESGAILVYLSSLAAQDLSENKKAAILSWVAWANASLDPICFLETPEGKVYVPVFLQRLTPLCTLSCIAYFCHASILVLLCRYDTGLRKPSRRIDTLNSILEKRDCLVGDEFTVADVAVSSYLLYVLQFFPDTDLSRWPHMVAYMKNCASRPYYGKAFGENIQKFLVQALQDTGKPRNVFDLF